MPLEFVDLFSGAGLFSAGMQQAGMQPVFAVELAADAVASYRRNVSDCIVQGSVSEMCKVPRADVLIAGPPCQGFSTLGRRDPTDERNALGLAVIPWVRKVRPKIVVIENVPPFLRSPQWQAIASSLEDLGFEVFAWELEATDYGAPQRRRRAFTIASKVGEIKPPRKTGRAATAGQVLFDPSRPLSDADPMHRWPEPKGVAAERIALVPPRGDKRDIVLKAPALCPPSWFRIGCQATDVWGRIDPDQPANTIRCTFQNPSKGRYLHPYEHRVLSLREGARLQGVPDEWVFEGLPYPVARQIGNGVPLALARAVGRSVRRALA